MRTIRVPPAAMLGSWMGTDFTNDDLGGGSACTYADAGSSTNARDVVLTFGVAGGVTYLFSRR